MPEFVGPTPGGDVWAAIEWDPDGAGPATPVLVFGGYFFAVAGLPANYIAAWDPATHQWSTFGAGTNGTVRALTVAANGDLIAGGDFTTAGGAPAKWVARWDGTTWTALGTLPGGLAYGGVKALLTLPGGDIVAGGEFGEAVGGRNKVARWDGTDWQPFGNGLAGGALQTVSAMALWSGQLVVGGGFIGALDPVNPSGPVTPLNHIGRWTGTNWVAMGQSGTQPPWAMTVLPTGALVANGGFTFGAQTFSMAQWNGGWAPIGAMQPQGALYMGTMPNGDLVVTGQITTAGGVPANNVARWNGTVWSPIGSGLESGYGGGAICGLSNGDIVVGTLGYGMQRWNGTAWRQFGSQLDGIVRAIATGPNGELIAGGQFTMGGDVPQSRIGIWNGIDWAALGGGLDDRVFAVATLPNGDVVAGGAFLNASGAPANYIARWDGTAWSPLGSGTNSWVHALAVLPNGDLIAGGYFTMAGGNPANYVARWDGTAWSPLGVGTDQYVLALAVLPGGDVVAGGAFTQAGGAPASRVARWNPTAGTWSPLGGGTNGVVRALLPLANGGLIVGGTLTAAAGITVLTNYVARWNGAAWSAMPGLDSYQTNGVHSLAQLPDGDIVAGGEWVPGGAQGGAFRWNGSTWVDLGFVGTTYALANRPNGDLAIGGSFYSVYLKLWRSTCPATAQPSGAGCPSSGGSNTLTATTLPWVESTFRATGTGLPSLAIVLAVTSVTPIAPGALPLSLVLPQGVPGCDLLVTPDLVEAIVTTTGTATSQLSLPNSSLLIGATFHHQMVPIEIDPSLAFLAVTATNALALTAGVF